MAISSVGAASSVPRSSPSSAPDAVRDPGELYAPWKVVNNVENGHPKFVTTFETRTEIFDPVYNNELLGQLDAFVHQGKSSLTPYEAASIGQAANVEQAPVTSALSNGQVELGDRVQYSQANWQGGRDVASGIVDSIDAQGNPYVLNEAWGSQEIDGKNLKIDAVTAGALDDGRPVQLADGSSTSPGSSV